VGSRKVKRCPPSHGKRGGTVIRGFLFECGDSEENTLGRGGGEKKNSFRRGEIWFWEKGTMAEGSLFSYKRKGRGSEEEGKKGIGEKRKDEQPSRLGRGRKESLL